LFFIIKINKSEVLDKYGWGLTTHFYLIDIIKDLNLKYDIIMRDELPDYLDKNVLIDKIRYLFIIFME